MSSSRHSSILKNLVSQEIEEAIAALAIEQPAFGQARIANELRKRGLGAVDLGDKCPTPICRYRSQ